MAEISTAQAADGSVKVASPQTETAPKGNANVKASGRTGTRSKPKSKTPEVNERGVVRTQWDNPKADPNLRKHIGESPDGEGNEIK